MGHPTTPLLQVLLRWNVQRGVAVLPKASSQSHMLDNIQGLWEWQLTYEQKVRRVQRAQEQMTMFMGDLQPTHPCNYRRLAWMHWTKASGSSTPNGTTSKTEDHVRCSHGEVVA